MEQLSSWKAAVAAQVRGCWRERPGSLTWCLGASAARQRLARPAENHTVRCCLIPHVQGNRRSKPTEADTPDTTPGHTVGEPVGMAAFHELERQLKAQQPEHSGGGT